MFYENSQNRYRLKSGDPDSSWRTFRDCDPSSFKSIFTGTGSVPLKGKWMDLDDRGEVSTRHIGRRFVNLRQIWRRFRIGV